LPKNRKTAAKNRQERAFKKHLSEKLHCNYQIISTLLWLPAAFGKNVGTCKIFLGGCGIGRLLGLSRGVY